MPKYKVAVTLTAIVEADHQVLAESAALRNAVHRLNESGLGVHVGKIYPEPLYLMLKDDGYSQIVQFFASEAQRGEALRALKLGDGAGDLENVFFIDESSNQAVFYGYRPSLDEYAADTTRT